MVWLVWAYTTWVTNWLDPDRMAVRVLLVVLMLISLAMSAALPRALENLGLWIGVAYAIQQIGRTAFMVIALRGHLLQRNFLRIGPGVPSAARSPSRAGWPTATPGICCGWAQPPDRSS
jgi:low temperature requirement protein LtrA